MSMFLENTPDIDSSNFYSRQNGQNNYNSKILNAENIYKEKVLNLDFSKISVIKYSGMLYLKSNNTDSVNTSLKTYYPENKKHLVNNLKKQNISICFLTPIFPDQITVQFDEKILATLAL